MPQLLEIPVNNGPVRLHDTHKILYCLHTRGNTRPNTAVSFREEEDEREDCCSEWLFFLILLIYKG